MEGFSLFCTICAPCPKGYVFSAVLVINRVSILSILVINWVCFLHSSLELGICPFSLSLTAQYFPFLFLSFPLFNLFSFFDVYCVCK